MSEEYQILWRRVITVLIIVLILAASLTLIFRHLDNNQQKEYTGQKDYCESINGKMEDYSFWFKSQCYLERDSIYYGYYMEKLNEQWVLIDRL